MKCFKLQSLCTQQCLYVTECWLIILLHALCNQYIVHFFVDHFSIFVDHFRCHRSGYNGSHYHVWCIFFLHCCNSVSLLPPFNFPDVRHDSILLFYSQVKWMKPQAGCTSYEDFGVSIRLLLGSRTQCCCGSKSLVVLESPVQYFYAASSPVSECLDKF